MENTTSFINAVQKNNILYMKIGQGYDGDYKGTYRFKDNDKEWRSFKVLEN